MSRKYVNTYIFLFIGFVAISIFAGFLLFKTDRVFNDSARIQLKWQHQFQFAGYYAAKEKGYYDDLGIQMELIPYKDIDPVQAVIQGEAEFGIGNSELIIEKSKGSDIVVLAAVFQHSPLVFLTKENTGIDSVQGLVGKRVGIEEQATELDVFLGSEGIKRSQIKVVPHTSTANPLISGEVDVLSAYVTDEPYEMEKNNISYVILSPRSSGLDFYGDCLFTSKKVLEEKPELVKRTVEASIKGWRYAFSHEDELIQIIRSKYDMRHSVGHLKFEAQQMRKLVLPDLVEIGYMNSNRWQAIETSYRTAGMIENEVNLNDFIYAPNVEKNNAFMSQFLLIGTLVGFLLLSSLWLFYLYRKYKRKSNAYQLAQLSLQATETRYKQIVNKSPYPLAVTNLETGELIFANVRWERAFGDTVEQVAGKSVSKYYVHANMREQIVKKLKSEGEINHYEIEFQRSNGERFWASFSGILSECEGVEVMLSSFNDITAQKSTEELLKNSQAQLQVMADTLPVIVIQCNTEGEIVFVNQTCFKMFDVNDLTAVEKVLAPYIDFSEMERIARKPDQIMRFVYASNEEKYFSISISIAMTFGKVSSYYVVLTDITVQKQIEERLKLMATTDELTGLMNRREFYRRAAIEIVRSNRLDVEIAIVMMDIDHFKMINDTFGHDVGDTVLSTLGKTLLQNIRATDILCRYGGEEMLLLLPDTGKKASIELAERLRISVSNLNFHSREGVEFKITSSFGIALFNSAEERLSVDELIQRADIALYNAKNQGRNCCVIYPDAQFVSIDRDALGKND